ncbi:hypothetical protein [Sphingomonas faeni]|uniref:hypothetical protein n=1 Tax=Sphingomonas faeni TaxID=185950 RepID=UPI003362177F
MPEFLFSRATAFNMLSFAFDIPQDGLKAMTPRVRVLSTLGVPSKPRSDPNVHFKYGLREVSELAVAFALMDAHMPPTLAARYVTEAWDQFRVFTLEGIRNGLPDHIAGEYEQSSKAGPIAVVAGNAISSLGVRAVRDSSSALNLAPVLLFADAVGAAEAMTAPSSIVLNARSFMTKIIGAVLTFTPEDEELRASLDRLCGIG